MYSLASRLKTLLFEAPSFVQVQALAPLGQFGPFGPQVRHIETRVEYPSYIKERRKWPWHTKFVIKRKFPVKDPLHIPQVEDREEGEKLSKDLISKINEEITNKSHGRLFSIIHVTGKQFKVTNDDVILVQGYWAPTVGDKIRFEKILLTGSANFTLIGRPILPRDLVRIEGTVIEKTVSYTQYHFIFKKRKNYKRLRFHKTPCTMVRINGIEFDGLVNEVKEIEGLRDTIF